MGNIHFSKPNSLCVGPSIGVKYQHSICEAWLYCSRPITNLLSQAVLAGLGVWHSVLCNEIEIIEDETYQSYYNVYYSSHT